MSWSSWINLIYLWLWFQFQIPGVHFVASSLQLESWKMMKFPLRKRSCVGKDIKISNNAPLALALALAWLLALYLSWKSWSTPAYWFIAHGGFHPIPKHQLFWVRGVSPNQQTPRRSGSASFRLGLSMSVGEESGIEVYGDVGFTGSFCRCLHEFSWMSNKTCNNSSLNNPNSHGELQKI